MLWRHTFAAGPLGCNCTVLADAASRQAVVVDPGGDATRLLQLLYAQNLEVVAVLHTHAHVDHLGATHELVTHTAAPAYLHPDDRPLLQFLPLQAAFLGIAAPPTPTMARALYDGDEIVFGSQALEVMHTPGHSPGSVCLQVRGGGLLLSGDTLFAGGVGRSDLWGGDPFALRRSLRERVLVLDDDTEVVTGHGPGCTVGQARSCLRGALG